MLLHYYIVFLFYVYVTYCYVIHIIQCVYKESPLNVYYLRQIIRRIELPHRCVPSSSPDRATEQTLS